MFASSPRRGAGTSRSNSGVTTMLHRTYPCVYREIAVCFVTVTRIRARSFPVSDVQIPRGGLYADPATFISYSVEWRVNC